MDTNVISLADYKKKKQELVQQYYWWLPQFQFIFLPPFFCVFVVY